MNSPFNLQIQKSYAAWRDAKRTSLPRSVEELIVDVADPRQLTKQERTALLERCNKANMAIYRSHVVDEDKSIPKLLGAQLGLHRLDCNWLADDDGISPIAVARESAGPGERAAFIPYTDRAIKWHTDGYYHTPERQIRAMVLHCVRDARSGGENALMDYEMAYIAMREANPDYVKALMAADAMTIPERTDEDGVARPAQSGPVFSVNARDGQLHMRYTARTRSIVWKNDPLTKEAVEFLARLLESENPAIYRARLHPGMGLVCNNVLHDRAAFEDDPAHPRLLYRARFLDHISSE